MKKRKKAAVDKHKGIPVRLPASLVCDLDLLAKLNATTRAHEARDAIRRYLKSVRSQC